MVKVAIGKLQVRSEEINQNTGRIRIRSRDEMEIPPVVDEIAPVEEFPSPASSSSQPETMEALTSNDTAWALPKLKFLFFGLLLTLGIGIYIVTLHQRLDQLESHIANLTATQKENDQAFARLKVEVVGTRQGVRSEIDSLKQSMKGIKSDYHSDVETLKQSLNGIKSDYKNIQEDLNSMTVVEEDPIAMPAEKAPEKKQ